MRKGILAKSAPSLRDVFSAVLALALLRACGAAQNAPSEPQKNAEEFSLLRHNARVGLGRNESARNERQLLRRPDDGNLYVVDLAVLAGALDVNVPINERSGRNQFQRFHGFRPDRLHDVPALGTYAPLLGQFLARFLYGNVLRNDIPDASGTVLSRAGVMLTYLPAYSPDLNPIEMMRSNSA